MGFHQGLELRFLSLQAQLAQEEILRLQQAVGGSGSLLMSGEEMDGGGEFGWDCLVTWRILFGLVYAVFAM